jgi:glutathione peroxidase
MLKRFLAIVFCGFVMTSVFADDKKPEKSGAVLDLKMKTLKGEEVDLAEKYKGKVVLVVNVASKCGLTPQYSELQELHEKYGEKGLALVGFPCNQFGKQEPGSSDEIASFCKENYGVTFDMFEKVEVNGDGACELYKQLTSAETKPQGAGKISWNFEKFIISRDGKVAARFGPRTTPDDKELIATLEKELGDK